jgi:hypothetical protein
VSAALLGAAWTAIGLLVAGRGATLGAALAYAAAAYIALRLLLPLTANVLETVYWSDPAASRAYPAWSAVFVALDPTMLQERFVALSLSSQPDPRYAELPTAIYNRIGMFLLLILWSVVPLAAATALAEPPVAPPPKVEPAPEPPTAPEAPP